MSFFFFFLTEIEIDRKEKEQIKTHTQNKNKEIKRDERFFLKISHTLENKKREEKATEANYFY
jgi:hypothetical protein